MSFVFNEYSGVKLTAIIAMFLRDADRILNSKTDFETRVALLEKWSWVLHGFGYPKPVTNPEELTPRDVEEKIRDMLKWVASWVKASRV